MCSLLELNWNQRLRDKMTEQNICHHMLTSSTQLRNRSFHVVERTRTSPKCQNMKDARARRAKILFFIVKYINLWGFCCRPYLRFLRQREPVAENLSFFTFTWKSLVPSKWKCTSITLYNLNNLELSLNTYSKAKFCFNVTFFVAAAVVAS